MTLPNAPWFPALDAAHDAPAPVSQPSFQPAPPCVPKAPEATQARLSPAPQRPPAPPEAGIPQWCGQYGGRPDFATLVLRDTQAWETFWKQTGREAPRLPDPAREMGVVVFIGERGTGGYVVRVIEAAVRDQNLVVVFEEVPPAPDKIVTQALANPWVAALVPRSDLPVVFQQVRK